MKSAEEWRVERWEDQDFIITGFGIEHSGVFSKREADMIVSHLKAATPIIQLDACKQGMTEAAVEVFLCFANDNLHKSHQSIIDKRDSKTTL